MRFALPVAFFALACATPALADTISIETKEPLETQTMRFDCADKTVDVTYHNAGDIMLAVLDFDDQRIVAANVISGSGARYEGKQYVWWTKGDTADFYNLMEGGEDKPISCVVRK